MSPAENAIENAVIALKEGMTFEAWSKRDQSLKKMISDANEVWDMAQWVWYTFKPYIEDAHCEYCEFYGRHVDELKKKYREGEEEST